MTNCQSTDCKGIPAMLLPMLLQPPAVSAYERRDVGGPDRSPETAAMNESAFRTNSRLEKAGFPLDSAEQQAATLASALSDLSFNGNESKEKTNTLPSTVSKKKKKTTTSTKNAAPINGFISHSQ